MLIVLLPEAVAKIAIALLRITLKSQLAKIIKSKPITLQTQPLIILNQATINQLIQIPADQFALCGRNYGLDLGIGHGALGIGHGDLKKGKGQR
jgi:hypothetical protein